MKRRCCLTHFGECCCILLGAKYSWGMLRQWLCLFLSKRNTTQTWENASMHMATSLSETSGRNQVILSHASLAQRLWSRPPSQPGSGCHLFASMEQAFHGCANDSWLSCQQLTLLLRPQIATQKAQQLSTEFALSPTVCALVQKELQGPVKFQIIHAQTTRSILRV